MHKVKMPKLGMAQSYCLIERWIKKEGDKVKKGDSILEVSTDKISYEIEVEEDGYVLKILKKEKEEIPVGEIIALIGEKEEIGDDIQYVENLKEKTEKNISVKKNKVDTNKIKISSLAKRLAEKNDIDILKIKGTGPRGRITKEDVESYLIKQKETPSADNKDINIKISEQIVGVRKIIAEKMTNSNKTIPHISQIVKADVTSLADLKERLKKKIKGLSFTDLFLKATALALRQHLELNSSLLEDRYIIFEDINIGLVTAIPEGLVIPVIKACDKKSLIEIVKERRELVNKALENKLGFEDISRGTFTISNLGMYRIKSFSAIIYPGQSSILAVGSIYISPEFVGEKLHARKVVELTLSEDHRIIDGATGSKFLMKLIELIESPDLLEINT